MTAALAPLERVLVTGAAGLLGRHVVDDLLGHGARVTSFDQRAPEHALDWVAGDVADPVAVASAVRGQDAVVHLAARANIWSGSASEIMRVNTLGTWNVFQAAEAAGVRRVVLCSSDSVVGYTVREGRLLPPRYAPVDLAHPLLATDPYALSKILGEAIGRSFAARGMEVIALRPVFIAYPEMEGEIRARARDPESYRGRMAGGPSSAGGGPLFHHVDPRDAARAFRLALRRELAGDGGVPFEAYFVSAEVTLSPEPTLQRLERLLGNVPLRSPEVYARNPFAPLYDLAPSRERLGFTAEFEQRHLIGRS